MRINFVLPILAHRPIGGVRVTLEYADYLTRQGHQITVIHARRSTRTTPTLRQITTDAIWRVWTTATSRPLIPWHSSEPRVRHCLVGSLAHLVVPPADATVATAWQTAEAVAELGASAGQKFYFIQHYETWNGSVDEVDATWQLPMHKIVIAKWLIEVGRSLGQRDITYVPNGINLQQFRTTKPIQGRPMQVVTINHGEPTKGVADVITALRVFHAEVPEVPILMFGALPAGPEIPAWVNYYENPTQDELIESLYNASSVYVGGSTVEGWGLPAAEAMACGCTFVGTDIGGFREFAVHGQNALLGPAGDPDKIARHLLQLSDDCQMRERLQLRAHQDIQSRGSELAGRQFEAALHHHLSGSGAEPLRWIGPETA